MAKNLGFLFLLPIVIGLLPWLLDRRGVAIPNSLIVLGGCVVIAGIAFGLFYPLHWLLGHLQILSGGSISYAVATALIILCTLAVISMCIWGFAGQRTAENQSVRSVKTELRLQFYGDTRIPSEVRADNVYSWYTLWNPHAKASFTDASGKLLSETIYPKTWNIFVIFERPVKYRELAISFSGSGFPQYEVKAATDRFAIINVTADIPAGDLEIYAKP